MQTPDLLGDPDFYRFAAQFLTTERKMLMEKIVADRTRHIAVVLEDIYQSQNASAVLRSCDCFGIQDVHIIENRNTWNTHRDVEQGSSKWLSIHRYNEKDNNTSDCLLHLKKKGYLIVGTTPHSNTVIDDVPADQPLAVVFGTEFEGISEQVYRHCDLTCRIPMYGFTESFNISVAAAVSLHALRRKAEEENSALIPLPENERIEVLIDWCGKVLRNFTHYKKTYLSRNETGGQG